MAGIVLHGAQFGRDTQRIGNALGGSLVVGRKRDTDVAIVEDGIVLPVSLFNLIERLCDQKTLEAVAGHEGERGLKKIQPAERRKLVEHEQQTSARRLG